MNRATVVETALFNINNDIKTEEFKTAMINYQELIKRKNGVSKDKQYLELEYLADLNAIKLVSEKVIQIENMEIENFFEMINEDY